MVVANSVVHLGINMRKSRRATLSVLAMVVRVREEYGGGYCGGVDVSESTIDVGDCGCCARSGDAER